MRTMACVHTLTGHTNTVADVKCQATDPQVSLHAVLKTNPLSTFDSL